MSELRKLLLQNNDNILLIYIGKIKETSHIIKKDVVTSFDIVTSICQDLVQKREIPTRCSYKDKDIFNMTKFNRNVYLLNSFKIYKPNVERTKWRNRKIQNLLCRY